MSARKRASAEKRTKISFHEKVDSKDKTVVLFYATWCPFSRAFLPIFEEYSKNNPNECLSVIVDEEPEICDEFAIEYYPTVILFRNGKLVKRLDSEPHVGLSRRKLKEFTEEK